jgi:hypothetical protein
MTQVRPRPRQGVYEKPFWDFVSRRELRLQCCTECGHRRYPPAATCPKCMSFKAEWKPLSGRGTVLAWTVFHRQYFPQLPVPYAVLSVQTEEGPLMIGNFVGGDIASLKHGMPVKAVFEEVAADDGGGWTIFQWAQA